MKILTLGTLFCLIVLWSNSLNGQSVWTQHNDQDRTGWYPHETILDTSNVNQNAFGLQFSHTLDDKIMVQPLVVLNVNIPNKGIKNVVYVATLSNTVYAFDADANTGPYWQQNYTNSITPGGPACNTCRPANNNDIFPSLCDGYYGDFFGNMGIIGTPVIDTTSGTMYFVSKIVNGTVDNHQWNPATPYEEYTYLSGGFHQYLHAIDITTGLDRPNSPVEITASVTGTGDGQTSTNIITFNPRTQFNRTGLALNNGILYITFAAHCDNNPSHGWVISYDASTLALQHAMIVTPNDGRGGIWMSGTAPAIDPAGNLYFATGNSLDETPGTSNTGIIHLYTPDPTVTANRGESVVKLASDLTISSYFTPYDYVFLNTTDEDFGTQVMLLPNTNLVMTGNKNDSLYIMNRTNLGGFNVSFNNVVQSVWIPPTPGETNDREMHSNFAYFGGPTPYLYQYSENSQLMAYPVTGSGLGTPLTVPVSEFAGPSSAIGGFLSVSSKGPDPATGVLWAYQPVNGCNANGYGPSPCHAILHAVSANNITRELWNSDMVPADTINGFNKFICPTIALGKVYLPTNYNQLFVYGLKANTNCAINQALSKNATALSNNSTANNVTDGNLTTSWTSQAHPVDSIYIDLQGSYDICKIAINWDATGYGKNFILKVSNDKINWTTVSSYSGNTSTNTVFNGAVTGRYVSMVGSATGGTSNSYIIDEFQVYGNPSSSCPPLTGLNASSGTNETIFTIQTPKGTTGTDAPVELGVKFRSAVPGYITGIRFYKTAGYTGTHTGELFLPTSPTTGTLLNSADFTGETASGWQTVTFGAPVPILANTTYVAAYYNATGIYVSDNSATAGGTSLATAITNNNLTALADGTDGANGVYTYSGGKSAFPSATYNSSNYWVDPVFSTAIPPDPHSELISWDAFSGASQYTINYRPSLSASWLTRTANTNGIVLSALSCGTLYDYTVQANCGASLSVVSQGSFTPTGCPATTCGALPANYFNVDLGDIGKAGSTCFNSSGSVYTLSGSGTDIGNTSDQFQFAFNSSDIADYEVTGRIVQQDKVSANNKIGVMVRDSLTNTSRFAFVGFVNATSIIFEYRDAPSGPVTVVTLTGVPPTMPYWVKISKSGTMFTAYTSSNGSTWAPLGSTVQLNFGTATPPHYGMAITSADNTLLSTGQIDNFSITGGTPLPIKLLSFTAQNINNNHILVSWSDSMEHLVDRFEVQRSADNTSFQTIQTVKAVGESLVPQYYSVKDNQPLGGMNYYRLKEVDLDGKFYYSPVVSVQFDKTEGLEIYPNPAGNYTGVYSMKDPIVEINIYDIAGKLLQKNIMASGRTSIQVNTSVLSKGVYIIAVKTTSAIYRQKLFKQ